MVIEFILVFYRKNETICKGKGNTLIENLQA